MRRLLFSAITAAALPGLAAAQERPSLLDFFSFDILAQRILQSGVLALRTQVDLQYSDMSVDIFTGKVTLLDIAAWPYPDWDQEGTCKVEVDRVTLRTGALDQPDRLRLKMQLSGLKMPGSCLPRPAQEGLKMAGLSRVDVPRLTVEFDYGLPASDAVIRAHAWVTDVATVDVAAEFSYLFVDGRDDIEEPLPVMFLSHASAAIENRGIWEALKPLVPPPFTGEGAGLVIEGGLGEQMLRENRPPEGGGEKQLTESQTAFLKSLATVWPAFLASPETLVLETSFDGDVFLDLEEMDGDLALVFDTLMPIASLAPSARQDMLPTDLLLAARDAPDGLSPEDLRRVGIAFTTGVGAPQNRSAGIQLLNDFAMQGDAKAAMVMAEAIADAEPESAYRWALLAGRGGEIGATALLDRIEKKLPLARILELQDDVSGNDQLDRDALAEISMVREKAAMRLSGRGLARSYGFAAMWAMIGSAAGDAESGDMLNDVLERVRLGGASDAWRDIETRASTIATELWLSEDLPARYGRN
ncbi:Sel1 domain protein repeat-containing protein [Candidatus Rhodobacter oscarellae]|uniref:Sel1 domain protein repeat-containing protein n=1 Tax=Candidatus Rhodobacter oscarellae TaxID=1675527 RepID=A0A0J9E4D9_9RHOB|nr:hypothetical protein [Candidatus Rhodobacter lobularis]KMW56714.1 Sel1 domain protein repeat-containing protein [Candidatus Rhodobacter lobularis]